MNKEIKARQRENRLGKELIMTTTEGPLEKTAGWCLNEDKLVELTCPFGVVGALFSCPYCGSLWKRPEEQDHIFNPSRPLVERLERDS